MSNVLLALKIVLLATLGATLLAGIIGEVVSMVRPDHAHQIFPTWIVWGVVGGGAALACSLITSSLLVIKGGLTSYQTKVIYGSIAIGELAAILLTIWYLF